MGADNISMLELDSCGLASFTLPPDTKPPFPTNEHLHVNMHHLHSKLPGDEDLKHESSLDGELKIQDYVVSDDVPVPPLPCNLEDFRSKKYYLFNAEAHDLMITSLLDGTNPSASEISVADPTFQPLPWQNKRGITFTCAIEDRWRDFKAKLGVKIDLARKRFLFHKRDTSRYIPHTGQWLEIVRGCHIDAADRHWGRNLTKHQITKRWMYGERNHGIPESFVDAYIDSCGCCRREQVPVPPPPPPLPARKRKLGKKLNTSLFDVQFIKQKLDEIAEQVASKSLEGGGGGEGGSSSEFEKIDEDEQSKLKEKITAIRNEMDSMLVQLPGMSRGKFLHFLEAMNGALTELRSTDMENQPACVSKPALPPAELHESKDDFLDSPKPVKRVKWKDLARSA